MSEVSVRVLTSRDAAEFQALRLRGLQEAPAAFSSSYEEECELPLDTVVGARLDDQALGVVFGAFVRDRLVGVMGVRRERHRKLAHRAMLWGVYVAPEGRGHGVARAIGDAALDYARTRLAARQIVLGVATQNAPAIALYEKLGFESFGIEKNYICIDGKYHDEQHMIRFFEAL
jgi:RimJ/RimL family protein N-acetyltransferase